MWKTIAELVEETKLHRTTFLHAIKNKKFFSATRQSGKIWMIDDEHPEYLSWLQEENTRGRPRFSSVVIIKASMKDAEHPVWAEIRRAGSSMSDVRDMKNRFGLNDEQEQAYLAAYQMVKDGDIETAKEELEKVFTWVRVEQ